MRLVYTCSGMETQDTDGRQKSTALMEEKENRAERLAANIQDFRQVEEAINRNDRFQIRREDRKVFIDGIFEPDCTDIAICASQEEIKRENVNTS